MRPILDEALALTMEAKKGVRAPFFALTPGFLPGSSLPGGFTYGQVAGTNQTEKTIVTSWVNGTIARTSSIGVAGIGMAPNGVPGLRLTAQFTNYVRNSERFDLWTPTGVNVPTANTDVSPDGTQNADTLTDDDAAGYEAESATSGAIPNDNATYRLEVFAKKTAGQTHAAGINWNISGGTPVARSPRLNTNDGTSVPASGYPNANPFGPNWWRWQDLLANNTSGNTVVAFQLFPASTSIPLPGVDAVAGLGSKVFYGASITRGNLKREYQPTIFEATCMASALNVASSRFIRGGRLEIFLDFSPSGAPTDYDSNFRFFDHSAETTYAEFSATDQKLRIVVAGGAAEVCAVPLWWPSATLFSTAHPRVQVWIETGGNRPSKVRYRYSSDGGLTWTLPFDPMGGVAGVSQGNISIAGNLGIMTGATAGNVADGWCHDIQGGLIGAVPAWALQWLPTDDANVKAWFRADGHYQLSAGLVSGWTSQTAAAISASQGTAAFQPTFGSALVNGRPGVNFDGTNDSLAVSGLTVGSGDLLVSAAMDLTALLGADTGAFIFDSLTGRFAVTVSDSATSGNLGYFDNVAWRAPGPAATTGAQVLTYDLRVAPGGRIYKNGILQGTAQTYSAIGISGQTAIGSVYNNTGRWTNAKYGDIVIASSQSDSLRNNIHAFHATKYGLSVA